MLNCQEQTLEFTIASTPAYGQAKNLSHRMQCQSTKQLKEKGNKAESFPNQPGKKSSSES